MLHHIPVLQALLQGLPLGLGEQLVPLLQPAWQLLLLLQPAVQLLPPLQPAVVLPFLPGGQSLPLPQPSMQILLLLQLAELPAADNGMLAKC